MRKLRLKPIQIILILIMFSTVMFIFVQSILPPEKSQETSDAVGEVVGEVIPPETDVGSFVQINLRKIAHFVEFALLGVEAAVYIILYGKTYKSYVHAYPAALFIALLDETIQIFSDRGPSVSDIWLDFAGFVSTTALVFLVYFIYIKIRESITTKKETDENG